MPEVTGYLEKYNGTKAPSSKRKNSFGFGTVKAGKWERRFFVLREGSQVLSIYKTPEDAASSAKPAQGTITAAGSMIIKDPMDETTFAISKDGKTTYLRAGHAGARSAWLEAIGTAGASVEEMPVAAAGGSGEMAGQLLKQGTGGLMGTKWDKRYLTLREGQLMVFKSESDASGKKPPLATMTLQGARIDVVGVGKSDDKVTFALSRGDKVRRGGGAHSGPRRSSARGPTHERCSRLASPLAQPPRRLSPSADGAASLPRGRCTRSRRAARRMRRGGWTPSYLSG